MGNLGKEQDVYSAFMEWDRQGVKEVNVEMVEKKLGLPFNTTLFLLSGLEGKGEISLQADYGNPTHRAMIITLTETGRARLEGRIVPSSTNSQSVHVTNSPGAMIIAQSPGASQHQASTFYSKEENNQLAQQIEIIFQGLVQLGLDQRKLGELEIESKTIVAELKEGTTKKERMDQKITALLVLAANASEFVNSLWKLAKGQP